MKTISILGCGWLGLPLGEALVKKGYTVKGSTTSPQKLSIIRQSGIAPYLLEVDEEITGNDVKEFFNADLLLLMLPPASRKDPDVESNYPRKIQTIINHAHLGQIQKVIFISTTGVYANINDVVDETSPTQPVRPSGKAVLTAERLLGLQEGLDFNILRMAGLVGGSRKAGQFLAGKKNLPNGKAPVNLVHLEDCIGVILRLIDNDSWNSVYNVCADRHPLRSVFYTQQAIRQGLEPPTFLDSNEESYKIISNLKLKKELNYEFSKPDPMDF